MEFIKNRKLKRKVIAPLNIYDELRNELKYTNKEVISFEDLLNQYSLIEFSEEKAKQEIRVKLLSKFNYSYINDNNYIDRLYKLVDKAKFKKLDIENIYRLANESNITKFELYKQFIFILTSKIRTKYDVFYEVKNLLKKDIENNLLELTYISDFYTLEEKNFFGSLNLKKDELEKNIFMKLGNIEIRKYKNVSEEIEWIARKHKKDYKSVKITVVDESYISFIKSTFARHNIPLKYREKESVFKKNLLVLLDYIITKDKKILLDNNFFNMPNIVKIKNFYNISEKGRISDCNESLREVEQYNKLYDSYINFLDKVNILENILNEEGKVDEKLLFIMSKFKNNLYYNDLELKFINNISVSIKSIVYKLNISNLSDVNLKIIKKQIINTMVTHNQEVENLEIYGINEISPYKKYNYIVGANINNYPTCVKDYALFEKLYNVFDIDDFEERYEENIKDLQLHNFTAENIIYTISKYDLKGKKIYPADFNFEFKNRDDVEKVDYVNIEDEKINSEKEFSNKYNLGKEIVKELYLNTLSSLCENIFNNIISKLNIKLNFYELTEKEKADIFKVFKNEMTSSNHENYYIFREVMDHYKIKEVSNFDDLLEIVKDKYYLRTSSSSLDSFVKSPLSKLIETLAGRNEELDFDNSATKGTIQHKILEVLYSNPYFLEIIKKYNDNIQEINKIIEITSKEETEKYFEIYNKEKNKKYWTNLFTENIKGVVYSLIEEDIKSISGKQEYGFIANFSKYAKDLNFNALSNVDFEEIEGLDNEYKKNVFKEYPIFIKGFIDRIIETEDKIILIDYKSSERSINIPKKLNDLNKLDSINLQLLNYIIGYAISNSSNLKEYTDLIDRIESAYVTIKKLSKNEKDNLESNNDLKKSEKNTKKSDIKKINLNSLDISMVDFFKILSLRINKYILSGKIHKDISGNRFPNKRFKVNIESRGLRGEK